MRRMSQCRTVNRCTVIYSVSVQVNDWSVYNMYDQNIVLDLRTFFCFLFVHALIWYKKKRKAVPKGP